jgi:hypothetical protein
MIDVVGRCCVCARCKMLKVSPQAGSNHRPFAYEASALPLSYRGDMLHDQNTNNTYTAHTTPTTRRRNRTYHTRRHTRMRTYCIDHGHITHANAMQPTLWSHQAATAGRALRICFEVPRSFYLCFCVMVAGVLAACACSCACVAACHVVLCGVCFAKVIQK